MDVVLNDFRIRNSVMSFVDGTGLVLAHDDLLAGFAPECVTHSLRVGRVLTPRGSPVKNWNVVNALRKIIVRGSKSVGLRKCALCGRNCYFALRPSYIAAPAPAADMLHGTDLYGLLIAGELYTPPTRQHRGIEVEALEVIPVPVDGFGPLPFYSR